MSEKEPDFAYDEDDAVKFIQNYLPIELKDKFSDDDIKYILDLVDDFYESKEGKNVDFESEEDVLIEYIIKNADKDNIGQYEHDEVMFVLDGELEYCESLNIFD